MEESKVVDKKNASVSRWEARGETYFFSLNYNGCWMELKNGSGGGSTSYNQHEGKYANLIIGF